MESDAVLFGAVGDWKYDTLDRPLRPEQAILGLRKNVLITSDGQSTTPLLSNISSFTLLDNILYYLQKDFLRNIF